MIFGKDSEEIQRRMTEMEKQLSSVLTLVQESRTHQDTKLDSLEQQFVQFSVQFAEQFAQIGMHLNSITQAREEVEKSTRTFMELQRKMEQFVRDKLGTVLQEGIQSLRLDVDRYSAVKKDIEQAALHIRSLTEDIAKFKMIANEIKQADFELVKYAKELDHADAEKVKLMKEVDELQRLVSKMRRGQHS